MRENSYINLYVQSIESLEELKLMAMGLLTGFRALAWAIVLLMAARHRHGH